MKKIAILIIILLFAANAHARIYIPVDQPSDKPFPIAVATLKGKSKPAREIASIIRHDLFLSGYFLVIDPYVYDRHAKNEGVLVNDIDFNYWSRIEAGALVKGEVKKEKDQITVELRLFDPFIGTMLTGKRYMGTMKDLREISHRFSDEVMEQLTGIRGVFNTRIAYSSAEKKGRKGIYIMDMDGMNPRKVTNNKSINISPNWSPDGKEIVFTSYLNGNPDLYVINQNGSGLRSLISGIGAHLTPAWAPNGKQIALSSTIGGESDIFLTTPKGGKMKSIISDFGIDISPTWSPDSSEIIFSSERAGGLHLFKVNSNGRNLKRLTYVGYQNDMPAWSPMGDKVAFAGRDMGAFDIFIMNPDGSNIQRLTIRSGDNEHPTWSPDGRWISFSSTRGRESAIYIMRADGTHQIRISPSNGSLPDWGPWRK